MWINPNNHALDGGRASSAMEKEAVAEIARMFGWETHLGHLTGGGTMANLEALWIADALEHQKKVAASEQAHFTHQRICGALKIPFTPVPCDARARMDVGALREILDRENVGTVVVTIGTTAAGAVDPLLDVLELREEYGFRIHADAAYGGYFILADNLDSRARAVYDHLSEVDSIVVDPHKHGLQPYGCGSVLFKDPSVGRIYKHDSPYTYFTSHELHLGEISLECSRAGAAAVALWATQRMFPLVPGGRFAQDLSNCRRAALRLYRMIGEDHRFIVPFPPELDIVLWAPRAETASTASKLSEAVFREAARLDLHFALANLPRLLFEEAAPEMKWDQDQLTCLRACVMKPEHLDWIDKVYESLEKAADNAFKAMGTQ
jgi:glutamate/tyrosine decarboxylase-like PLP-dependent enzyme